MIKRTFLAAIAVFSFGGASAAPISVDGCAELARVVYDEVQAKALYGSHQSGPWIIPQDFGDVRICKTVARTVSRAYTQAMASAGYSVSWVGMPLYDDQICDSVQVDHCIPDPRGGIKLPEPMIWQAVSFAVRQQMPNPYSSDEIRFNPDELRLRLGLALRNVSRPLPIPR